MSGKYQSLASNDYKYQLMIEKKALGKEGFAHGDWVANCKFARRAILRGL
jgi:hypothetical protein